MQKSPKDKQKSMRECLLKSHIKILFFVVNAIKKLHTVFIEKVMILFSIVNVVATVFFHSRKI